MQSELLFKTNYLGSSVKVYTDKVEFKMMMGGKSIPIDQISTVQLGIPGHWQIIIETTGGQKHKIPTHKKKQVRDAIYKAQSMKGTTGTSTPVSFAEELTKLADLRDRGILSQSEFEEQKRKLTSK